MAVPGSASFSLRHKFLLGSDRWVVAGIRPPVLFRHFHRGADLDERTFADARTILTGAIPLGAIFDQFRPERERSALRGLGRMQAAAMRQQKRTLFFARLAKSHLMARAVHVLFLERARRHVHEFRGSPQVVFRQIDEPFLIATVDAASLAGEAEAGHFLGFQMAVWRMRLNGRSPFRIATSSTTNSCPFRS